MIGLMALGVVCWVVRLRAIHRAHGTERAALVERTRADLARSADSAFGSLWFLKWLWPLGVPCLVGAPISFAYGEVATGFALIGFGIGFLGMGKLAWWVFPRRRD